MCVDSTDPFSNLNPGQDTPRANRTSEPDTQRAQATSTQPHANDANQRTTPPRIPATLPQPPPRASAPASGTITCASSTDLSASASARRPHARCLPCCCTCRSRPTSSSWRRVNNALKIYKYENFPIRAWCRAPPCRPLVIAARSVHALLSHEASTCNTAVRSKVVPRTSRYSSASRSSSWVVPRRPLASSGCKIGVCWVVVSYPDAIPMRAGTVERGPATRVRTWRP